MTTVKVRYVIGLRMNDDLFIQGVQGHKRIEETVYRLESIFKGKRRLI